MEERFYTFECSGFLTMRVGGHREPGVSVHVADRFSDHLEIFRSEEMRRPHPRGIARARERAAARCAALNAWDAEMVAAEAVA